jgi:hypothetical protein
VEGRLVGVREHAQALNVASDALGSMGQPGNPELGWRLAAVAFLAARRTNEVAGLLSEIGMTRRDLPL